MIRGISQVTTAAAAAITNCLLACSMSRRASMRNPMESSRHMLFKSRREMFL